MLLWWLLKKSNFVMYHVNKQTNIKQIVSLNTLPHRTSVTVAGLTGLLLCDTSWDTKSRVVPPFTSQVVFPLSPNTYHEISSQDVAWRMKSVGVGGNDKQGVKVSAG